MKIGIVADKFKDPNFYILEKTAKILSELGVEVVYPDQREEHRYVGTGSEFQDSWDNVDIAISIGGDGTFLYTCREIYGKDIPIIGVNRGSFGFLAEIDSEKLEASLKKLIAGDFIKKSRLMLDVKVINMDGNLIYQDYALNDAVLYRGDISRIIPCELNINARYIQTIPSDGIIVAGPSGSTGYALSCGGPIVDPELDLVLVTPISPHTLQNRTYVVKSSDLVEIAIKSDYLYQPYLSVDGRIAVKINNEQKIQVRRAEKQMEIICIEDKEFFAELPGKLKARGI